MEGSCIFYTPTAVKDNRAICFMLDLTGALCRAAPFEVKNVAAIKLLAYIALPLLCQIGWRDNPTWLLKNLPDINAAIFSPCLLPLIKSISLHKQINEHTGAAMPKNLKIGLVYIGLPSFLKA